MLGSDLRIKHIYFITTFARRPICSVKINLLYIPFIYYQMWLYIIILHSTGNENMRDRNPHWTTLMWRWPSLSRFPELHRPWSGCKSIPMSKNCETRALVWQYGLLFSFPFNLYINTKILLAEQALKGHENLFCVTAQWRW